MVRKSKKSILDFSIFDPPDRLSLSPLRAIPSTNDPPAPLRESKRPITGHRGCNKWSKHVFLAHLMVRKSKKSISDFSISDPPDRFSLSPLRAIPSTNDPPARLRGSNRVITGHRVSNKWSKHDILSHLMVRKSKKSILDFSIFYPPDRFSLSPLRAIPSTNDPPAPLRGSKRVITGHRGCNKWSKHDFLSHLMVRKSKKSISDFSSFEPPDRFSLSPLRANPSTNDPPARLRGSKRVITGHRGSNKWSKHDFPSHLMVRKSKISISDF